MYISMASQLRRRSLKVRGSLTSFILCTLLTTSSAKRAGEPVAIERTPETKRAKLVPVQSTAEKSPLPRPKTVSASPMPASSSDTTEQSAQPSNQPPAQPTPQPAAQPPAQSTSQPVVQPAAQPTSQPAVQPPTQPASEPAVQAPAVPHAPQPPANPQVIQMLQRMSLLLPKKKHLEEECTRLLAQKQAAIALGKADAVAACDQQLNLRKDQHAKISQYLVSLQQQVRQAQLQSQANTPGQDSSQTTQTGLAAPALPRVAMSPQGPFSSTPVIKHRSTPSVQSPNHNESTLQTASTNPGLSSPATNPTPHMASATHHTTPSFAAAQIHNLNEASRHRPGSIGPSMSPRTNGPPANVAEAGIPQNNNNNNNNITNNSGMQQPQGIPAPQPVLVWEGLLKFNGTGSDGQKKEVHTGVSASSSNASNRYRIDVLNSSES
jgi:hypothetical protein